MTTLKALPAILCLALTAAACVSADAGDDAELDNDPPLADVGDLHNGAPDPSTLPDEGKADADHPELHTELVALQSPIRSQGRRGVCSIFSTVALMEHLYIKEGTMENPDFSEQFLQWSVKFELSSFPNTSGSNAYYNLQAINRYGIVDEATYPYETGQWGVSDDEECDGEDDQPTRCYTNGEPSDEVRNATRYELPPGRWLRPDNIKHHISTKKTDVVVGLTFFYQSWNHRRSDLPTNRDYWANGIVLFPNDKDQELSLEKRAGHSIPIIGWDDNMEAETMDENGDVVKDEDGDPVMEKGFYIFKNSWGTGSFGKDNPHGDGYGYISYRYVHEYGRAYTSGVPVIEQPAEVCGDGADNDNNGVADCDDPVCSNEPECQPEVTTHSFESTPDVAIPDNDPVGIESFLTIGQTGTIQALRVSVNITHPYRGDLRVTLVRGEDEVVLHDRTGTSDDDIVETFSVTNFDATDMRGDWRLVVSDHAGFDEGTLNSWTLEVDARD